MCRSSGRLFLALAGLLFAAKAVSVCLNPAGASLRILPNLFIALVLWALVRTGLRRLREPETTGCCWSRALLCVLGLVSTSHILMITWVDRALAERNYVGVYDDPYKVWAARGLVLEGPNITTGGTQNSIEAIRLAFESGAKGTEVDVYYDTGMGKYVVSHDFPYKKKNGVLLTLGPLFDAVGDDGYFWIDFKKLRRLDADQLAAAVAELEALTSRGDLKERVYVEGEDPLNLHAFQRAGFPTIYDTHPLADSNPLTPLVADLYKAVYYFGDYTVLGLNSGELDAPIYGPETRRALRNVPVFVYHAPDDAERLIDLASSPDVRVILVGDHSLNRYDVRGPAASD